MPLRTCKAYSHLLSVSDGFSQQSTRTNKIAAIFENKNSIRCWVDCLGKLESNICKQSQKHYLLIDLPETVSIVNDYLLRIQFIFSTILFISY